MSAPAATPSTDDRMSMSLGNAFHCFSRLLAVINCIYRRTC